MWDHILSLPRNLYDGNKIDFNCVIFRILAKSGTFFFFFLCYAMFTYWLKKGKKHAEILEVSICKQSYCIWQKLYLTVWNSVHPSVLTYGQGRTREWSCSSWLGLLGWPGGGASSPPILVQKERRFIARLGSVLSNGLLSRSLDKFTGAGLGL